MFTITRIPPFRSLSRLISPFPDYSLLSSPFSAKLWSLSWSGEQGNHPDVELLAILDHDHPVRAGTLTQDADVVATATDTGDIYLWSTDDPNAPMSVLNEVR